MPYGNEYFPGDGYLDLHFVLFLDGSLEVAEMREETVSGSRCSPCNFDQYLSEVSVSVCHFSAFEKIGRAHV